MLDAFEVFRDVREVPFLPGQRAPLVIVGGKPTNPHHRVCRRRSTEHFSSRPIDLAPVELLLRLGQVVPIHLAAEKFDGECGRDVNELILVPPTGLQHGDPNFRIVTEPAGNNRTRGTGPDDDVVGLHPAKSRSRCGVTQSIRSPLPVLRPALWRWCSPTRRWHACAVPTRPLTCREPFGRPICRPRARRASLPAAWRSRPSSSPSDRLTRRAVLNFQLIIRGMWWPHAG